LRRLPSGALYKQNKYTNTGTEVFLTVRLFPVSPKLRKCHVSFYVRSTNNNILSLSLSQIFSFRVLLLRCILSGGSRHSCTHIYYTAYVYFINYNILRTIRPCFLADFTLTLASEITYLTDGTKWLQQVRHNT